MSIETASGSGSPPPSIRWPRPRAASPVLSEGGGAPPLGPTPTGLDRAKTAQGRRGRRLRLPHVLTPLVHDVASHSLGCIRQRQPQCRPSDGRQHAQAFLGRSLQERGSELLSEVAPAACVDPAWLAGVDGRASWRSGAADWTLHDQARLVVSRHRCGVRGTRTEHERCAKRR